MLDIGWFELLTIAVLCLFIFGPDDIPNIMYNFGRMMRRVRYLRYALSSQFEDFMEKAENSTKPPKPKDAAPKDTPFLENPDEADGDLEMLDFNPPPETLPPDKPVILPPDQPQTNTDDTSPQPDKPNN